MLIGVAVRIAVASAFVLSASWKLSHIRLFVRAFEGFAPPPLRAFGKAAVGPVVVLEATLAGMLIGGLAVPQIRLAGLVLSLVFLVVMSAFIARAKGIDECGCWAMPFIDDGQFARRLLLARNAVLGTMLALAAALPVGVDASIAAAAPAGFVLGIVAVELPQIVAVATYHARAVAK